MKSGSTEGGLASAEAEARRRRDGPNLLPQPEKQSPWRLLLALLREPMLLLLLAAAGVYLLLGDRVEAVVLAVSVVLVLALTLWQEARAEQALHALRELGAPRARVLRDGAWARLPAAELVVDDVVEVSEGDRVPADARVLRDTDLLLDESMLTGESVPVRRGAGAEAEFASLSAGTLVVRGHALARVTATGAATAIGRIGASLGEVAAAPSPLQAEVRQLVRAFALMALAACGLVALLAYARDGNALAAVLAGITLAIAMVPEEFPLVLVVFLALGALRMSRQRALVRRMPAIETLGAVTVLCTDKTGTLTENRMRLAALDDGGGADAPSPVLREGLRALLELAASATRANSADPMDRALQDARAQVLGTQASALPNVEREYAFSPACPAVGQLRLAATGLRLACKGAPEAMATLCRLDAQAREAELARTAAMAARGLRVLAVAEAVLAPGLAAADAPAALAGFGLEWRGLVAFADPLRAGAAQAVREARAAGVRVLMLTGDHVETAAAIAAQAGLDTGAGVLTGAQLEALDEAALDAVLACHQVFARVRPEHKLRLVEALCRRGEIVAMTGDGVNDAPALAAAHVGVAMGQRGTDVAREAADMVLLDDDFATIVRAIAMGRLVRAKLERAFRYLVAVHVPIAGLAVLPLVLGAPAVLLPVHVVFMELVIDPACAFVFERGAATPALMRRPPLAPRVRLLGRSGLLAGFGAGALLLVLVASIYLAAAGVGLPAPQVGALAFTTLVGGNVALVGVFRGTGFGGEGASFPVVAGASLCALAAATQWPAVATWFRFAPPPLAAWSAALALPLLLAAAWSFARRADLDRGQGALRTDG
jgi:Ca2+-transporting ATPase